MVRQAVSIEQLLVWVYQVQLAAHIINNGVGLHESERRAAKLMVTAVCGDIPQSYGRLGTRIDGGGLAAGALHSDAELVHAAVMKLTQPYRAICMNYGRTGVAPDPMLSPVQRWRPLRHPITGSPMKKYCDKQQEPVASYVELHPSNRGVQAARENYAKWRLALCQLALGLEGLSLKKWIVDGVSSADVPMWLAKSESALTR